MKYSIVISGLAGTFAMTLFIESIAFILKKPFHVVRILARMLLRNDSPPRAKLFISYVAAAIIHYTVGILFTWAFYFADKQGIIQPTYLYAIVFGGVAGTIGITGWSISFAIHPNPPKIQLPYYLGLIWVGHLVFSLGMFYSYRALAIS